MRQSGVVHSIISDRDRYAFPVMSVLAPKAESELVHWQPIRWDFAKSGAWLLIQDIKERRPLAHARAFNRCIMRRSAQKTDCASGGSGSCECSDSQHRKKTSRGHYGRTMLRESALICEILASSSAAVNGLRIKQLTRARLALTTLSIVESAVIMIKGRLS